MFSIRKLPLVALMTFAYTCVFTVIQLTIMETGSENPTTRLLSWKQNTYVQDNYKEQSTHQEFEKNTKRLSSRGQAGPNTQFGQNKSSKERQRPDLLNTKDTHPVHNSVLLRKLKENNNNNDNNKHFSNHVTWSNTHDAFRSASETTKSSRVESERDVTFHSLTSSFFIFAAVFDNRKTSTPAIRLFVLRSSVDTDDNNLVCIFTSNSISNGQRTSSVESVHLGHYFTDIITTRAERYEMCENHDKKYGGWIYSCNIPPKLKPHSIDSILVYTGDIERFSNTSVVHKIMLQKIDPYSRIGQDSLIDKNRHFKITERSMSTTYDNNYIHNGEISMDEKQTIPSLTHLSKPLDHQINGIREKSNFKIGICVPPLYGDINLHRIFHFVEMCRILGASKVFLYINDVAPDMIRILKRYSRMGSSILSLVKWTLPVLNTRLTSTTFDPYDLSDTASFPPTFTLPPSQVLWNRGQLLAIQHCLYANMHTSDWLLFLDIDEMLVPKRRLTWQGFLNDHLKEVHHNKTQNNSISNHLPVAMSFESAKFYIDAESQVKYSVDYFQKFRRATPTDKTHRKVMVRPKHVFELGIHHVSRLIDDSEAVTEVGKDAALIHHYRSETDAVTGQHSLSSEVFDDSILKYRKRLLENTMLVENYIMRKTS